MEKDKANIKKENMSINGADNYSAKLVSDTIVADYNHGTYRSEKLDNKVYIY